MFIVKKMLIIEWFLCDIPKQKAVGRIPLPIRCQSHFTAPNSAASRRTKS